MKAPWEYTTPEEEKQVQASIEERLGPINTDHPDAKWIRGHHLFREPHRIGGLYTPVIWLMTQGIVSPDDLLESVDKGLPLDDDLEETINQLANRYSRSHAFTPDDPYSQDVIGGSKEGIGLLAKGEAELIKLLLFADGEQEIIISTFPYKDPICVSCAVGKHCIDLITQIELGLAFMPQTYTAGQDITTIMELMEVIDGKPNILLERLATAKELEEFERRATPKKLDESDQTSIPQVALFRLKDIRGLMFRQAAQMYKKTLAEVEIFLNSIQPPTESDPKEFSTILIDPSNETTQYGSNPPIISPNYLELKSSHAQKAWAGTPYVEDQTGRVIIQPSNEYITILLDFPSALGVNTKDYPTLIPVGGNPGNESQVLIKLKPNQKIKVGTYLIWYDENCQQHSQLNKPILDN